jgi:hypothetical protein
MSFSFDLLTRGVKERKKKTKFQVEKLHHAGLFPPRRLKKSEFQDLKSK